MLPRFILSYPDLPQSYPDFHQSYPDSPQSYPVSPPSNPGLASRRLNRNNIQFLLESELFFRRTLYLNPIFNDKLKAGPEYL